MVLISQRGLLRPQQKFLDLREGSDISEGPSEISEGPSEISGRVLISQRGLLNVLGSKGWF